MRHGGSARTGREELLYGVTLLHRTVRFSLAEEPEGELGENGYGGRPAARGWDRHYELVVTCEGEPSRETGYLINIKTIDEAVREKVLTRVREAVASGGEPAAAMAGLLEAARGALPVAVRGLTLRVTPSYSVSMEAGMERVAVLSQRFEIAAAHRLHAPSMSDEENRRFFGKCNNPAGHGHNYVIEPRVAVEVGREGSRFGLADLERVTKRAIVEPFDHKHLNVDTAAFRDGEGVNPTVENIARVFYEILARAIEGEGKGATLRSVTVWETDRTSATYGPEIG